MSNILLALLFALLCFTQWQLSRQGTSLLCYLPTGLYLLIVGIASVRTILDDTFSLQAAVLLLTGLLILLAASIGLIVAAVLQLVYLYRTAKLFRQHCPAALPEHLE